MNKADSEIEKLKSQIKSFSTINNISIRNNNTYQYLNESKTGISLNKKNPLSQESNMIELSQECNNILYIN